MSQSPFEEEQKRIRKEIWSLIHVKDCIVIDVGVGESAGSTKTLIDKGASVIAIDNDTECLENHKDLDAAFVCCDIQKMPFKSGAADAVVFNFTLHEINPLFHRDILSEMAYIASRIIIVEPAPGTTPGYSRFEELWRESMHAVGEFEDYKPCSYWKELVQASGFNVSISKTMEHTEEVPLETRKEMVQFTTEWMKEKDVPEKYIDEAKTLLESAKEKEMRLSDIIVIIGESKIAGVVGTKFGSDML